MLRVILAIALMSPQVVGLPIEFGELASFDGDVRLENPQRILLVIHGNNRVTGQFDLEESMEVNRTSIQLGFGLASGISSSREFSENTRTLPPLAGELNAWGNNASLYLEAENINLNLPNSFTTMKTMARDCLANNLEDREIQRNLARCRAGTADGIGTQGSGEFVLQATNIRVLEVHGFSATCGSDDCISNSGDFGQTGSSESLRTYYRPFVELTPTGGSLMLHGRASNLLTTGTLDALTVTGNVRLPEFDSVQACNCQPDSESTLSLRGITSLSQLSAPSDGRFGAQLSGNSIAFQDEKILHDWPFVSSTVRAVTGMVGVGILLKLLLPLLVRPSPEDALKHVRRQALFEYIKAKPGATFRELSRETNMHLGTARHHLAVMKRAGLIDEKRHRSTLRYFENHGRFASGWNQEVLLREPALRTLHDWLAANPGAFQKEALDAMAIGGWSRSTTQHRLARLVQDGLVTIHLQGRYKAYNVVRSATGPSPPALPNPGTPTP